MVCRLSESRLAPFLALLIAASATTTQHRQIDGPRSPEQPEVQAGDAHNTEHSHYHHNYRNYHDNVQALAGQTSTFGLIVMFTAVLLDFALSQLVAVATAMRFARYLTYSLYAPFYVSSGVIRHLMLKTVIRAVQSKKPMEMSNPNSTRNKNHRTQYFVWDMKAQSTVYARFLNEATKENAPVYGLSAKPLETTTSLVRRVVSLCFRGIDEYPMILIKCRKLQQPKET